MLEPGQRPSESGQQLGGGRIPVVAWRKQSRARSRIYDFTTPWSGAYCRWWTESDHNLHCTCILPVQPRQKKIRATVSENEPLGWTLEIARNAFWHNCKFTVTNRMLSTEECGPREELHGLPLIQRMAATSPAQPLQTHGIHGHRMSSITSSQAYTINTQLGLWHVSHGSPEWGPWTETYSTWLINGQHSFTTNTKQAKNKGEHNSPWVEEAVDDRWRNTETTGQPGHHQTIPTFLWFDTVTNSQQ